MADAPHAGRIAKGYGKFNVADANVHNLNEAAAVGDSLADLTGVGSIDIFVEDRDIRITNDGSDPSTTNGWLITVGKFWVGYPGDPNQLRIARRDGLGTAAVHVFFWGL